MTREDLQIEIAVLVSLLLHALAFGAYQQRAVLARFPLFRPFAHWSAAARMASSSRAATATATPSAMPTISFIPVREVEQPKIFMETDASQESGQKPKNARYYSNRSTVAANPENPTRKTGETPYLNGAETRLMSTENVPLPSAGGGGRPAPARPAAPPRPVVPPQTARPGPVARPVSKTAVVAPAKPPAVAAKEPPKGGTLTKPAKPAPKELAAQGLTVVKEEPKEELPKGGTLAEAVNPPPEFRVRPAAAEPTPGLAPGLTLPQESVPSGSSGAGSSSAREVAARRSRLTASGIDRRGVAAFNVAKSPFGDYDQRLIRAVQSRWIMLIDQHDLYERAGMVTVRFELVDDGTVRGLQVTENTAGEILSLYCEKAILDSAPFAPLPEELRMLIGHEPRDVNFTFYY